MKLIRFLIADAGVATFVVIVVKIRDDAGLGTGQVGEDGPVAGFEFLSFQARLQAFRLGIVVAFAASAVRALGPGVAQQRLVGVAHVLPASVGVDNEAGGRPLSQQRPLQGADDQSSGHAGPHLPAHHMLGAEVLKGALVRPGPTSQRQAGEAAHQHPVGLGRARLVEQQIGRTALSVGRIGGAWHERLGLLRLPPVPAQSRVQGLAAHPVARFPQFDLQPARSVTAFAEIKNGHHFRFPGRLWRAHRPARLRHLPCVVAAGHHAQYLAELLDEMAATLLVNEFQRAHRVGGCEMRTMAFFKMSNSCANRLLAALARNPAASAGLRARAAGPPSATRRAAWR